MKFLTFLCLFGFATLLLGTSCITARHAVEDTADLGAQSVHKAGHVAGHGIRKVENL